MVMDKTPNRFLRTQDFENKDYADLRRAIDEYYAMELRGTPHPWGSKNPTSIKTHWSREWEYPWAIINSELNYTHKLLDCGCGGSPLVPYIVNNFGCTANGIDLNYGEDLVPNQEGYIARGKILCSLRRVFVNPSIFTENRYSIQQGSIASMPYEDNSFDRVYCISVIEHLESEEMGIKSIKEMARVLRPGGRLLVTMDHTSYMDHVNTWCIGQYAKIIEWSGLELMGNYDFSVPSEEEVNGLYHVLGFVLKK